eukprot:3669586-Rhodomonas_salina.1
MRRASEIFVNASRSMGLRIRDVHLEEGSHVLLFIRKQKNDPYSKGSEVVIAWVTGSGVQDGATLQLLLLHLQASGMSLDDALFCPTRECTGGFRQPSPSGFRAAGSLQTALKTLFEDCRADLALVKQFTWHSLRRGGASWAFRNNVPLKTVMRHG